MAERGAATYKSVVAGAYMRLVQTQIELRMDRCIVATTLQAAERGVNNSFQPEPLCLTLYIKTPTRASVLYFTTQGGSKSYVWMDASKRATGTSDS